MKTAFLSLIVLFSLASCVKLVDQKTMPDGTIVTVSTYKADIQSIASAAEVAEKITPTLERLAAAYKANTSDVKADK